MNNMDLYDRLKTVPEEAKKTIAGGRLKGFTDINPMWRIKMLTQEFGPCGFGWYIEEVERWTESGAGVTGAFVKIHLYLNLGGEWSRPIVGIGGSQLVAMEKNGPAFSDEAFKMAYTDAISVACKVLGMAADVYFDKDGKAKDNRTKYDVQSDNWSQPEKFPKPAKSESANAPATVGVPAKKRLVRGSDPWNKAVARAARGEEGLMDKLRSTYVWSDEIEADFSDDVFNYNMDNRAPDGELKTA